MSHRTGPTDGVSALRVAADAYYWKPSTAWFRALELAEYERLGLRLEAPVLDVGCGDGRVAWMLERLGLLAPHPIGTDWTLHQLRLATRLAVHGGLVRSDAGRLPFPDGMFRSVLCNGVICSVPQDFRAVLDEIWRILEPGGCVAISVPTDRFNAVLFWPRFLGRFSSRLRARYERAMDARQPHFWTQSPDSWREELENAGFEVVRVQPFFRRDEGVLWNLLAMHVLRFLGILRLVDGSVAHRTLGRLVANLLRRPFLRGLEEGQDAADEAGYVLLYVRRP